MQCYDLGSLPLAGALTCTVVEQTMKAANYLNITDLLHPYGVSQLKMESSRRTTLSMSQGLDCVEWFESATGMNS
ncbi:hypothetical protein AVEN_47976-1 [Araneus ventricosus]|uniref:Uncharacterized protein n=1 Tax=Araneus ventricosus TaxID=182803 RepID=A0A4Y2UEY1_ARAVE|nr:hypothetical protein AVEN_47976-1 [Araneus ventricosus]